MSKDVILSNAKVKLRLENDQIRAIISGGSLREPARLSARLNTDVGRELVKQYIGVRMDTLSLHDGAYSVEAHIFSETEVGLIGPAWSAKISKLDHYQVGVEFAYKSGFTNHVRDSAGAWAPIATVIREMGWNKRDLVGNTPFEVQLRLANASSLQDGRLALPLSEDGADYAWLHYEQEGNFVWLSLTKPDHIAEALAWFTHTFKSMTANKPRLVIDAQGITGTGLRAVCQGETGVELIYRRDDVVCLEGINYHYQASVVRNHELVGGSWFAAGEGTREATVAERNQIATYLNTFSEAGMNRGTYQIAEFELLGDEAVKAMQVALAAVGQSQSQDKVMAALAAAGLIKEQA